MTYLDYEPPSSDMISRRQNDQRALQLLIAQRRLYNRAKRWQGLRWIGLLILGIGGPFVALVVPGAAVIVGATTGVWLFVGRTLLSWLETRTMVKAACVQEILDRYLFGMPETISRSEAPSLEDIAIIAGDRHAFTGVAQKEKLLDWYSIDSSSPGIVSIAIAQRINAAYTDRLIRTTVTVWAVASALWMITLVTWASLTGVTLATFLLGALLPVLPAFLDVTEYILHTWQAAHDRADLAVSIANRLTTARESIRPQDLLVWQERLFELRRTTPQVPNWLYKLTRPKNENAMNQTARQLRENGTA